MSRDLPTNLRLLCSYHKSVAEVCRQLGLNRSQFNRYLSGETFPSLRVMRRICDFFGVDEAELLMPHGQFSELVRLKPSESGVRAEKNILAAIADDLRMGSRKALDSYVGYYFCYYNSMSHPGYILRSLAKIYRTPFGVDIKSVESVGLPDAAKLTFKYQGACFMMGDRIFMTVMETLTRSEVMQIILYPSYNNRIRYLTGLVSGVAARAPRAPTASQIVYQHLGAALDLRKSMRLCGLYEPDDPAVPAEIRKMLQSGMLTEGHLLEAPLT